MDCFIFLKFLHERTEDVKAVLSEGQEIDVKLIGFDRGKMKLSVKALAARRRCITVTEAA